MYRLQLLRISKLKRWHVLSEGVRLCELRFRGCLIQNGIAGLIIEAEK